MPINPKLKAIIEADPSMNAEYRTKLLSTMEDAPADFQNAWMMKEDYTRNMNKMNSDQADWKVKADEFYEKSKRAVTEHETAARTAREAAAAAEQRLREIEAGGVPNVPGGADALAKEVQGLKSLITTVNEKLEKAATADFVNDRYRDAVSFLGDQVIDLSEVKDLHQERFGKRFTKEDQGALIEFANKKAVEKGTRVTLPEAYAMKYGEEMKLKEKADLRSEITAELETKYKTHASIPGGGEGAAGGTPTERGPAQIRLEQERNRAAGVTDPSKIGARSWQEAAAEGANELIAEGKY